MSHKAVLSFHTIYSSIIGYWNAYREDRLMSAKTQALNGKLIHETIRQLYPNICDRVWESRLKCNKSRSDRDSEKKKKEKRKRKKPELPV